MIIFDDDLTIQDHLEEFSGLAHMILCFIDFLMDIIKRNVTGITKPRLARSRPIHFIIDQTQSSMASLQNNILSKNICNVFFMMIMSRPFNIRNITVN